MALQTGDRGIRSVSPMFVEAGGPWACSRCGVLFPREDSWSVDYCHADGDQYAFVVCPACARELDPHAVTIDLAALAAMPDTEPFAEIESLVRLIAERRGGRGDVSAITIRWMDLDVLASTCQMSVPEFVDWLRSEGLVAGEAPQRRHDSPGNGR